MQVYGYDRWRTRTGEIHPEAVCLCAGCGQDIFSGEYVHELDTDDLVHDDSDCILGYLRRHLNAVLRQARLDDAC